MPFNADDVRAAAQRIAGQVVRTPMLKSLTLSQISGAEIWLKFENQQFTAAYKERGALNALLQLTQEQRERGVIAASAGNHSQGLSYHGTRLGVPVTIVMPRTTPTVNCATFVRSRQSMQFVRMTPRCSRGGRTWRSGSASL